MEHALAPVLFKDDDPAAAEKARTRPVARRPAIVLSMPKWIRAQDSPSVVRRLQDGVCRERLHVTEGTSHSQPTQTRPSGLQPLGTS